jgi:hypothetical protein
VRERGGGRVGGGRHLLEKDLEGDDGGVGGDLPTGFL